MKIKCCNCERQGTKSCIPSECISITELGDFKYKNFKDYHANPAKFCEICGQRLIRKRNKGNDIPELRHVDLECPVHGIVGVHECQYRSKVRTAKAPA